MKTTKLSQRLKALEGTPDVASPGYEGPESAGAAAAYRIRVANDLASRQSAYGLIYRLYLEKEYARPHPSRLWMSIHDAQPDTVTLLAEKRLVEGGGWKVEGADLDSSASALPSSTLHLPPSSAVVPVGALTVVFDSPLGLPADGLFGAELDALRERGRRLAEIVSLGIAEETAVGSDLLVRLFNLAYLVARRIRGATDFVITVNPRHAGFYRRKLLFVEAGPERAYDRVGGAPAVLCSIPLSTPDRIGESERHRTIYRLWIPKSGEAGAVAELSEELRPMSEAELRHFLSVRPELLAGESPERRAALEAMRRRAGLVPAGREEVL